MGVPVERLAKRWTKEPGFKEGYDALAEEFARASRAIEVRSRGGLAQPEGGAGKWKSQTSVASTI
ncbi:MAG TPA: hypothetical protein VEP50_17740 [bacterium]|nr:hypothetical protein [bacterium]